MKTTRFKIINLLCFAVLIGALSGMALARDEIRKAYTFSSRPTNAQMLGMALGVEGRLINRLTTQSVLLMQKGGSENKRRALMFHRLARQHQSLMPSLKRLAHKYGVDSATDERLTSPAAERTTIKLDNGKTVKWSVEEAQFLGTFDDYGQANEAFQVVYYFTTERGIKNAMHRHAALARNHQRQLQPRWAALINKMIKSTN